MSAPVIKLMCRADQSPAWCVMARRQMTWCVASVTRPGQFYVSRMPYPFNTKPVRTWPVYVDSLDDALRLMISLAHP